MWEMKSQEDSTYSVCATCTAGNSTQWYVTKDCNLHWRTILPGPMRIENMMFVAQMFGSIKGTMEEFYGDRNLPFFQLESSPCSPYRKDLLTSCFILPHRDSDRRHCMDIRWIKISSKLHSFPILCRRLCILALLRTSSWNSWPNRTKFLLSVVSIFSISPRVSILPTLLFTRKYYMKLFFCMYKYRHHIPLPFTTKCGNSIITRIILGILSPLRRICLPTGYWSRFQRNNKINILYGWGMQQRWE